MAEEWINLVNWWGRKNLKIQAYPPLQYHFHRIFMVLNFCLSVAYKQTQWSVQNGGQNCSDLWTLNLRVAPYILGETKKKKIFLWGCVSFHLFMFVLPKTYFVTWFLNPATIHMRMNDLGRMCIAIGFYLYLDSLYIKYNIYYVLINSISTKTKSHVDVVVNKWSCLV